MTCLVPVFLPNANAEGLSVPVLGQFMVPGGAQHGPSELGVGLFFYGGAKVEKPEKVPGGWWGERLRGGPTAADQRPGSGCGACGSAEAR